MYKHLNQLEVKENHTGIIDDSSIIDHVHMGCLSTADGLKILLYDITVLIGLIVHQEKWSYM